MTPLPDEAIPEVSDDAWNLAQSIWSDPRAGDRRHGDTMVRLIAETIEAARRDPGLTAEVERLREALLKACEALENCYDVTAWPANGASLQDEALHAARAALGEA